MKKFLLACLCCLMLPIAAMAIDDGTYYLYNVGAGLYFDHGGSDNRTACLKPHYGAPVILANTGTDTYTIQTCTYDDPSYLGASGSVVSSATNFTIAAVGDDTYTISVDGKYLGYGGTTSAVYSQTLVSFDLTEVNDNALWKFLSKEELEKELDKASLSNPVDATFYIPSANFNRHDKYITNWKNYKTGYSNSYLCNNNGYYASSSTTSRDVYQALTGLKPGVYKLTAQAYYCHGSYTTVGTDYTAETMPKVAVLYAGDSESPLEGVLEELADSGFYINGQAVDGGYIPVLSSSVNNDAVKAFDNGMYSNNAVSATVGSDSALTIGIKYEGITGSTIAFDNFQLYYLGTLSGTSTWDLAAESYSSADESAVVWNSGYATMTLTKGTSTTPANNYLGGTNTQTRFYKSQVLTFSPEIGYAIDSIVITATGTNQAATFASSTWENATATADGSVVTVIPTDGSLDFVATISAATRATAIEVYYSVYDGVSAPKFSVTAGSYYAAQSVELTAAEGATIYYSTDGENFTEYTAAIAVAEDATIYAYAQVGEEKSATVSKSYVIAKTYTSLASLLAVEASKQPVGLVLTSAKITSVYTTSSGNRNGIYVTDGTDTIEIYAYDVPEEWTVGGFVSGTVYGTYQEYNGTKEVCPAGYDGLSYDPAPIFSEGKYYFYNVESGKFWGAGNSWGTQASLVDHAEYLTLHTVGGKYNIESQVSNGGTAYYFNGSYMDNGSPVALTIAIADTTATPYTYTITNGDAVYGYDGSTTVLSAAAEGDNAVWNILTEDDMKAKLAAATADAPADATWLILDPGFGRNNRNQSAWTIEASNKNMSGGNNVNNCAESYHSTFTLSQTLSGVPNGVYGLTAQGFYRQDGTDNDNLPVFYINDATSTFPVKTGSENSMSEASVSFSAGSYTIDPILVQVTDSTITLGAKNEANTTLWCIWDNFVLTYYGADADINQVQLASAIETYKNTLATAEELAADSASKADMSETVAAALAEAIANYAEATVLDSPTAESLAAATEALNAAVANANASVKAKATAAEYEDIISKNNFVTAEALATYQALADSAQAGWETGNTEAVVAPYSTGWHAANVTDDYLLSTWSIGETKAADYSSSLYINTWSVEGDTDGSEFHVPFFEYWTSDANSLGAQTLSATLTGLAPGKYSVSTWTRVRLKNNVTDAPTGIKFVVNDGDTVDVTTGAQVGTSQMYLDTFTAEGTVGEDSTLTIKYIVEDGNNISWLSFKNVKYTAPEAPAKVDTIEYAFESEIGGQYEGYTQTVDIATILSELGATSVDELNIYAVQSDGTLDSNYKLGTTDGWRNAAGDWQTWSPGGDSRLCVKADFSLDSEQIYFVGGMNTTEAATYKATYAFVNATEGATAEYDTVFVVVSLNYPAPTPVEAEVVETIEINHEEAEKTAYSGTYETVDVDAVCTALGITSIDDAEYRVAIPDGEGGYTYETVTTDGWRNAETGAQLGWGNAGGICVKVWEDNNQTTGNVTYIGCYDDTHEAGEAYTFYYAFIANNKSVIYKINISFVGTATDIDGIANGESAPKGIYNINGQKLSGLQKGLNIVDGKKVYVK